jgi:DNA-directed RNA polymerase specialized sigma24 family protein
LNDPAEHFEGDDLGCGATELHSPSLRRFLEEQYSRVCRITHSLCVRPATAKKAVDRVMRSSSRYLPDWKSAQAADNWFLHHTILMIREISGTGSPRAAQDYLIQNAANAAPAYIAFVRALRQLPPQQREAFLLSRCEQLEPRKLAIAMDCSTAAAANHLAAATEALKTIAGGGFEAQATMLAGVYASLTPPEEMVIAGVTMATGLARRKRWGNNLKRLFGWLVLALLAWTIWRLSRMIVI